MESDKITADMVEAVEFPHLAQRYAVMGVPMTVANGKSVTEGSVPESVLLTNVLALMETDREV
jgi:hypothetical protein